MRIFIAVDGSAHAQVVVRAAARMLRRAQEPAFTLASIVDASEVRATPARGSGAELPRHAGLPGAGHGLFAPESPGPRTVEDRAQAAARLREEARDRLHRLAAEHLAPHTADLHVEVAEDTGEAIARGALRAGADLIVLGTHGRTGLRRMVLGSVAQSAVHRSAIPAILVRQEAPQAEDAETPLRTLLPTDGSPRVHAALPRIATLVAGLGAEVTVVRVLELPHVVVQSTLDIQRQAAQRDLNEHVAALAADGIQAGTVLLEGYPARAVANFAREQGAELLLVPTHDRSEAGRIVFGSVADRLIHDSPCPVGLVKAREP